MSASKCKLSPAQREQEKKDIDNVGAWPRWPALPIKRYTNGDIECAIIVCRDFGDHLSLPFNVFMGVNLWNVPREMPTPVQYPSIDALLDDGWVGD